MQRQARSTAGPAGAALALGAKAPLAAGVAAASGAAAAGAEARAGLGLWRRGWRRVWRRAAGRLERIIRIMLCLCLCGLAFDSRASLTASGFNVECVCVKHLLGALRTQPSMPMMRAGIEHLQGIG